MKESDLEAQYEIDDVKYKFKYIYMQDVCLGLFLFLHFFLFLIPNMTNCQFYNDNESLIFFYNSKLFYLICISE